MGINSIVDTNNGIYILFLNEHLIQAINS